jgi:hypothetical protein
MTLFFIPILIAACPLVRALCGSKSAQNGEGAFCRRYTPTPQTEARLPHLIFAPGKYRVWGREGKTVPQLWQKWQVWLWPAIILAGSVFVTLIVHSVFFAVAKRVTKRNGGPIGNSLVRHAEAPTRWIFPLLAIILALPILPVRDELVQIVRHVVGLGTIAAVAWGGYSSGGCFRRRGLRPLPHGHRR